MELSLYKQLAHGTAADFEQVVVLDGHHVVDQIQERDAFGDVFPLLVKIAVVVNCLVVGFSENSQTSTTQYRMFVLFVI